MGIASVFGAAVALAWWACIGAAAAAEPVRVAYINGLSGTFAVSGEEQLRTFRAAADWVNRRGGVLGGRRLELVTFDNKNTTQDSLIMLTQAIDQNIRFVATTQSNVVHAVGEAINKHNTRNPDRPVLLLNFSGLDPALTESKCSFWHFRFDPHSDMYLAAVTDAVSRDPVRRRVYLLNQDYAYGQSVSRSARELLAAKRADIEIVGDDLIPLGKVKDFAPYVSKIRAAGADTVLTGNWGNDLSLLIKAAKETGLGATFYTLFGAFVGTPAAIGSAGADRVKSSFSWHLNAADPQWEARLIQYKARYKAVSDLAYLPPFRTLEMLAAAIDKAGAADPLEVALALEGMEYAGPSGRSWMRAEDHQLMAPIFMLNFQKAATPGAKHDAEGTGYGWKTDVLYDAQDTVPPLRCRVQRP